MDTGKLYKFDEFIVNVNYQLYDKSGTTWWGELVLTEYRNVSDGDGYAIELQDGRRGHCSLKKRVNRAVNGVPPLYHYQFRGYGTLK